MSTSTKVVIDPEVRELELFLDSRKLSNIGYMIILEATLCFKQVVRCLFLQLFCIVLFWNRVYNKIFEILGGWRGGSVWQRVGGGKEKGEGATSKKCDKSIRYPCLKTVWTLYIYFLFGWWRIILQDDIALAVCMTVILFTTVLVVFVKVGSVSASITNTSIVSFAGSIHR